MARGNFYAKKREVFNRETRKIRVVYSPVIVINGKELLVSSDGEILEFGNRDDARAQAKETYERFKIGGKNMKDVTLTKFNQKYEEAKEIGYKYLALKIETVGNDKPEIIINSKENFENKVAYVNKAYNEDLTLKNAPDIISIVGWVFAMDYDSIEKTLRIQDESEIKSIKIKCPYCGSTDTSYVDTLSSEVDTKAGHELSSYCCDNVDCGEYFYTMTSLETVRVEVSKDKWDNYKTIYERVGK